MIIFVGQLFQQQQPVCLLHCRCVIRAEVKRSGHMYNHSGVTAVSLWGSIVRDLQLQGLMDTHSNPPLQSALSLALSLPRSVSPSLLLCLSFSLSSSSLLPLFPFSFSLSLSFSSYSLSLSPSLMHTLFIFLEADHSCTRQAGILNLKKASKWNLILFSLQAPESPRTASPTRCSPRITTIWDCWNPG